MRTVVIYNLPFSHVRLGNLVYDIAGLAGLRGDVRQMATSAGHHVFVQFRSPVSSAHFVHWCQTNDVFVTKDGEIVNGAEARTAAMRRFSGLHARRGGMVHAEFARKECA